MANARVAGEPRVWDARHTLSASARAALEAQLTAAERKTGVPFFLLLTDRLHGVPVADLALDAFAKHGLAADPTRNAVLLAVAVDSGAAAVETGKGAAGIVPEIDARRIVKELTGHLTSRHPERAIAQALTQLAASARATATRRTPLPSPPQPANDAGVAAEEATATQGNTTPKQGTASAAGAPSDARVAALGDPGGADETGGSGPPDGGADAGGAAEAGGGTPGRTGRSRLPIAVGLGVLVLLGLALRRRRQIAATRSGTERDSDGKTRRPRS